MSSRVVVRRMTGGKGKHSVPRPPAGKAESARARAAQSGLARATPELARTIERWLAEAAGADDATLAELRAALTHAQPYWSADGDLLYPQDRTALIIEIDELIDRCGASASAREFIEGRQA